MPALGLHGRRIPSSRRAVLGNAWQSAKWVPASRSGTSYRRWERHKCATGQTVNLDSQIAKNLPTVVYLPTERDEAAARDPRLLLLASIESCRARLAPGRPSFVGLLCAAA